MPNLKKHSPAPESERISGMIIDAIVRSRSDDKRTAFKTKPEITEPVLQSALKAFGDDSLLDAFSIENGLLIAHYDLSDAERKALQEQLTQAEIRLAANQTHAEAALEKSLEARAKKAGVRLID